MSANIPKINPASTISAAHKPDGSPDDNNRVEIGPTNLAFEEWSEAGLTAPNLTRMRQYRLDRLCQALKARDYAGILLFDPLNIRYATDSTNMQLWLTHNFVRACFVAADGTVILWDFHGCDHLSSYLPLVSEVRHGATFFYFECADRIQEHAARFAGEIRDLVRKHGGSNKRVAVDKIEIAGLRALEHIGLDIKDGQEVTENTRKIKSADELLAMRCAIHSCEKSMAIMQDSMRAGLSENDIWSVLHAENIRRGGEWIETRLLSSGPRTNPWYQESGPRIVEQGDLLAFDTDLVGAYGFCCDISRTWLVDSITPTTAQKELYQVAHEQIVHNQDQLGPGVTFLELSEKAMRLPEAYRPQRYGVVYHGVGLCDEYPSIRYPEDVASFGYDGVLEPGMVVCTEAYIGAVGGREGVKLEDQILITETGFENLTNYPFEACLLG